MIQIMNGYECDGTYIFVQGKMECSIQRGEVKLNITFHLSNENTCTITRMRNIHYLFYITSFTTLNQLFYTGKCQLCYDRAMLGQRSSQCIIKRSTVPLHGTLKR